MRKFVLVSIILNIFLAACSLILVATDPELESVTLNYSSYEMFINDDLELKAIANPSKAHIAVYECVTSNNQVAIVDSRGYVQSRGVGECVIYVKLDNGEVLSCNIKVLPIIARNINLSVEYTTISVGYSQKIDYQVNPYNTTYKDITWTTSNSDIVSVDADGNIVGVSAGVATITAEVYGGVSETITITVQDEILPQELNLSKSSVELLKGKTTSVSYTMLPKTVTNTVVTWTTSNSSIATVNQNGTITGIKQGVVTITARTANGIEGAVIVTVQEIPATNVIIDNMADFMVTKLSVGNSIQMDLRLLPYNTTTELNELTFESRDISVALVSSTGRVTITGYGTTVIFIKLDGEAIAFLNISVIER